MHDDKVCCYTPNLKCHYRQLSYWVSNSGALTFTLFQYAVPTFFNNTGFINTPTHTNTVLMYTRIGLRHKHKPWVTKYFSVQCHTIQMADKYMQYVFLRHTAARFPSTTENSPSQSSATSRSPPTRHSQAATTGRPSIYLPSFKPLVSLALSAPTIFPLPLLRLHVGNPSAGWRLDMARFDGSLPNSFMARHHVHTEGFWTSIY